MTLGVLKNIYLGHLKEALAREGTPLVWTGFLDGRLPVGFYRLVSLFIEFRLRLRLASFPRNFDQVRLVVAEYESFSAKALRRRKSIDTENVPHRSLAKYQFA